MSLVTEFQSAADTLLTAIGNLEVSVFDSAKAAYQRAQAATAVARTASTVIDTLIANHEFEKADKIADIVGDYIGKAEIEIMSVSNAISEGALASIRTIVSRTKAAAIAVKNLTQLLLETAGKTAGSFALVGGLFTLSMLYILINPSILKGK